MKRIKIYNAFLFAGAFLYVFGTLFHPLFHGGHDHSKQTCREIVIAANYDGQAADSHGYVCPVCIGLLNAVEAGDSMEFNPGAISGDNLFPPGRVPGFIVFSRHSPRGPPVLS